MLTPDINGRYWNRGTKIGLLFSAIAMVVFAALDYLIHTSEVPDYWLPRIGTWLMILPLPSASYAYACGQRDKIHMSGTEKRAGE